MKKRTIALMMVMVMSVGMLGGCGFFDKSSKKHTTQNTIFNVEADENQKDENVNQLLVVKDTFISGRSPDS